MKHEATPSIDSLMDDLFEADLPVAPIRLMDRLIAAGDAAVEPLLEVVREVEAEPLEMAPVWAAIILGRLRCAMAAPVLAARIQTLLPGELTFPVAAAEALASIGASALPSLRTLAESDRESDRLWAYYAAGRMRAPEAVAFLLSALERDTGMIDVIALALGEAGDAAAIAPLERAAERAQPWQRSDVAEAVDDLRRGSPDAAAADDWRLRYRLNEFLAPFPMVWPVIVSAVLDVRHERPVPDDAPPAAGDESEFEPVCEECGEPRWMSTGVPVCACTAVTVPALQASMLDQRAEALGSDDLFDILYEVEFDLLEAADRPEPRSKRARERHEDDVLKLRFQQVAIAWAVDLGAESVGAARDLLLHDAEQAAAEHGDPDGVFEPDPPPVAAPKVNRNAPCPCGSGRKYKKCCGAPGAAPAVATPAHGPPPGLPRLVTFDDEPVVFSRAHYDVTDRDAVARALDACPDMEATEPGQYVWFRRLTADERRPLGTISLERPGRLTLECMSRERLARGRALLESIAAPSIRHRLDTAQDPWRAAAEAGADPRRSSEAVPSEIEGPLLRQVMDRHYRTWPDESLPALNGQTAREAVRTADGRRRVAQLLRSFEAAELRRPPESRYDFGWMWQELGLRRS